MKSQNRNDPPDETDDDDVVGGDVGDGVKEEDWGKSKKENIYHLFVVVPIRRSFVLSFGLSNL